VVCEAPAIGELKTGDLSGFRVHKFKFHGQEYLVAYLPSVSDPEPGDGDRPTPVISVYQRLSARAARKLLSVRRYLQKGQITLSTTLGRSLLFSAPELRAFKKALKVAKG